jgi:hypothetical protein
MVGAFAIGMKGAGWKTGESAMGDSVSPNSYRCIDLRNINQPPRPQALTISRTVRRDERSSCTPPVR